MPTKNPRLQVVLERPLYEAVARLAKKNGTSMSMKVRDLVRDALDYLEDAALVRIAEKRALRPGRWVPLEEVEARFKRRKR